MRDLFYTTSIGLMVAIIVGWWVPGVWWAYAVCSVVPDPVCQHLQHRHTILRNFPVLGYARFFFEFIAPESSSTSSSGIRTGRLQPASNAPWLRGPERERHGALRHAAGHQCHGVRASATRYPTRAEHPP